jgi:hypothetical protein
LYYKSWPSQKVKKKSQKVKKKSQKKPAKTRLLKLSKTSRIVTAFIRHKTECNLEDVKIFWSRKKD